VFRGIKCYKYYNNSGDDLVFGDDTTGAFYGRRTKDGYDFVYQYKAESYTPQRFAFDSSSQSSCPSTSFQVPTNQAWDASCKKVSSSVGDDIITFTEKKLRNWKNLF